MKASLLLQLCEMYKEENKTIDKEFIDLIIKFSDDTIKAFMKLEDKESFLKYIREKNVSDESINANIIKLYGKYAKGCNWKYISKLIYNACNKNYISDENLEKIIKILEQSKDEILPYVVFVITNCDPHVKEVDLILADIVAKAKGIIQAKCACEFTLNTNIQDDNKVVYIAKIIANAKGDTQANVAYDVAKDEYALESNHIEEIISIIANSKKKENVRKTSKIPCNKFASKSNDVVELTNIAINAKGLLQTSFAVDVACNNDVLKSGKAVLLTNIVANTKKEEQSRQASYVATCIDTILSGKITELTKIVSEAKTEEHAMHASGVARNKNALSSDKVVELTKIVANAKGKPQGYSALLAACDKDILSSNKSLELVYLIANAKDDNQAACALDVARTCVLLASDKVVELTRMVANAKDDLIAELMFKIISNKDILLSNNITKLIGIMSISKGITQAECAYKILMNNYEYKDICKLIKFIATVSNPKVSEFIMYLTKEKNINLDYIINLIDILGNRINANNFDAILDLVRTGEYLKSDNPILSFKKILNSTYDYKKFNKVYVDDEEMAIKGLQEMNSMFKDIELNNGNCYVKYKRNNEK